MAQNKMIQNQVFDPTNTFLFSYIVINSRNKKNKKVFFVFICSFY